MEKFKGENPRRDGTDVTEFGLSTRGDGMSVFVELRGDVNFVQFLRHHG